jgi:hypothetical protein
MQNFYMKMAKWQVSRWHKEEQPCLVEGEEGWRHSQCCMEDPAWWPEVVASPEVGEKEGESEVGGGGRKI